MKQGLLVLQKTFSTLTRPRSTQEGVRRQEFILNVLLMGTLLLTALTLLLVSVGFVIRGPQFRGVPPSVVILIGLAVSSLYMLSRQGFPMLAARLFIFSLIALGTASAYAWGIALPSVPLVFVLAIVMAGILLGTQCSFVMTGLISFIAILLAYWESHGIIHPDVSWAGQPVAMGDASAYVLIWSIIALVASLSNRELKQSLKRAQASETALSKQRDLLEVRVEERTRELKQAQLEKILQLNRFADFGRISATFFHDIINPLTAVSLNLEQLSTKRRSELLQEAIRGLKHIEGFAQAARKQVQGREDTPQLFRPAVEVREAVDIMEGKARGAGVTITCHLDEDARLFGSIIKFHQMVSNLIANAIDAYDGVALPLADRVVQVTGGRRGRAYHLAITDHGVGIPAHQLERVFDPFFTTKPVDKGTGIGLLIVKQIVEDDFKGHIGVTSQKDTGTVFTMVLPAAHE
jgi:signal transduction histidine kinase